MPVASMRGCVCGAVWDFLTAAEPAPAEERRLPPSPVTVHCIVRICVYMKRLCTPCEAESRNPPFPFFPQLIS